METYRNDPFDSGQASRKTIILAVIVGFHVLLVAALNSSLSTIVTERVFGPVETTVLEEPEDEPDEPPPPPPVVETPPPFVPPPDIVISDLPAPTNSTAISKVTNVKAPPPPPPPPKQTARTKAAPDARTFKNNWTPEIPPSVTREAKKSGELGATTLVCTINPQGRCDRVDITESSGIPRLDEVAQKHAMRVWKFTPAMEDGKPVADQYQLRIRWNVIIEKG
ncbi:MAG: energy transducer TonB [Chromatiales bacterium]|jgi:protein TonB|nr:energy transducer TonB [Chromatiales bacterium]